MTEPFAVLAAEPLVLVLLAAWGFGEAIALPVVPDVLLGLLALAAPWLLPQLLGITLAGGTAGAIVAWWLAQHRPGAFEGILLRQPGLGPSGLAEARERLARLGPLRAFAQVGPGLPVKAHIHALASLRPATSTGRVGGLALVNRLTRIGPVSLAFAALHPIAAAAPYPPAALGLGYAVGWTAFYLAYWRRRSRREASGT